MKIKVHEKHTSVRKPPKNTSNMSIFRKKSKFWKIRPILFFAPTSAKKLRIRREPWNEKKKSFDSNNFNY